MVDNKYKKYFSFVTNELKELEKIISINTSNKNFDNDLNTFITPSKKIRFLISILLLKAFDKKITKEHYTNLATIELLHNATLLHDDVLDEAETRRGQKSFNQLKGNNLSILCGDFLFADVIENILKFKSKKIQKMYSSTIKTLIEGEIEQNYTKFEVPNLKNYIEKSQKKTAALFELAINSSFLLCKKECSKEELKQIKEFSKNFGIAFQICDDLKNYVEKNDSKSDIKQGIYTAPVIFALQACTQKNISDIIRTKSFVGIEKTQKLIDKYFNKALKSIESINNIYSKTIIDLVDFLKE